MENSTKKLTLKRETLRNLQDDEMKDIEGGLLGIVGGIAALAGLVITYANYCDTGLLT